MAGATEDQKWRSVIVATGHDRAVGKTAVLLLGVPHLANPGRDAFNLVVDDVLAEHRQRELVAVTTDLARFSPTKVLVEAELPRAQALAQLFNEFVAGSRELDRGEDEQIGFRVAALCGLDGVKGIDVSGDFWDSRIDELAGTDDAVARRLRDLQAYGDTKTAEE